MNREIKRIVNIQFFNISSSATLKETFTAKYNGVLPSTPKARPNVSEIYTPKRDDEHPRPYHMGVIPPGKAITPLETLKVMVDVGDA